MYSFPDLEPVCCSMSSSNRCFLTYIRISPEAGKMVWYSHLFENFPQFVVIHTVKGFGIVNIVEVDVFLKLSCFFDDPTNVGNLISGSSNFSKSSLNIWKQSGLRFGWIQNIHFRWEQFLSVFGVAPTAWREPETWREVSAVPDMLPAPATSGLGEPRPALPSF